MDVTGFPYKRLVIVSYRLPFKISEKNGEKNVEQSSGGLVSTLVSLSRNAEAAELYRNVVWVGKGDEGINDDMQVEETGMNFRLVPVAIENSIDKKFYGGFCNDLLWPLFHYFPSLAVLDESYFKSYVVANKLFAEKIKSLAQPGDFIWIHDYHLFLLPSMLRDELPSANIGFFLHIPFPTFELFRILPRPWGEAILRGVLGSDLIGFHIYDYCQYFLRSVSRFLGYEITMNTVAVEDRIVRVDAYPIGIDYEEFSSAAARSPEVEAEKTKILSFLKNQKLIFSVDRLDYSKGFLLRLAGFEYFLDAYPEWIGKTIFNMVIVPSRDTSASYQEMKHEIEAAVGRINGKYSTLAWLPILYQYKFLSFPELVALYSLSDVGLITPIRDGMNLVAKEYIACQTAEKGMLILSETAGASAELCESLLINPTDKREVADALNRALTMPARDRGILVSRMQRRIRRYTVFSWATDIIQSVAAIKKEQELRKVNLITIPIESEIITKYRQASRRVIFIDYDGTLVPFSRIPELAIPEAQTMHQLKLLVEDPKNSVVIISGRIKDFMEEWLGQVNAFLIAEHGAFQKAPRGTWECTIDPDQTWKEGISAVLQRYLDRCNGSFIEEKFSSLVWHYRNSSEEIGPLRAKELTEELRTLVSLENKLQVLEGNKVIEVKRTGYDKGLAAAKFISSTESDFIIAMGDDKTDEDIFHSLPSYAITIKIGLTASLAKYNLINQRDVARFIGRLLKSNARVEPATQPSV
ncbi:MAG: bifunctional alpha,alpha-trehalose-phosphate synthase (UDP-forming)/trehalose-phosphatase [Acidobacteriota bacterium]|jgi:trehalose 6-phosphate synthase/phosphatase